MSEECLHKKLERDVYTPMCTCFQCREDEKKMLDCQKCGKTVMREGDPGFAEEAAKWPMWYDVEDE